MKNSALFLRIIEDLEKDLTQNSNKIRNILEQVKTLQLTYDLQVDHFNQQFLEERINFFANEISQLIHSQTILIELYARISGHTLVMRDMDDMDRMESEMLLFEGALSYYTFVENYEICIQIKAAADAYIELKGAVGNAGGR